MAVNSIGDEILLEPNAFNILERRTGLYSVAQLIQNICIFEKGTYPNQPNLGVGIENYLFEMADDDTLEELIEEINSQIDKYVPNNFLVTPSLEKRTVNGMFSLVLTCNIKDFNTITETDIAIIYGRNQKTQKLLSRLIV